MKMKTLLILGGLGVGAWFLMKKSQAEEAAAKKTALALKQTTTKAQVDARITQGLMDIFENV